MRKSITGKTDRTVVLIAVAVVGFFSWMAFNIATHSSDGTPPTASDRANIISSIGVAFTGVAFVGLLWSAFLQRRALEISMDAAEKARLDADLAKKDSDEMRAASQLNTRLEVINSLVAGCHTRMGFLNEEIFKVENSGCHGLDKSASHQKNLRSREALQARASALLDELDTIYEQSKTHVSDPRK